MIRMTEWATWRNAWGGRKTQNTVHGFESSTSPEVGASLTKSGEWWYFYETSGRSHVNIPELNERFEKIEKSIDVGEIRKLMAEIFRYAYDHYLSIPICEIPDVIATTKRIPQWNLGQRRVDRNYYDLIKQR